MTETQARNLIKAKTASASHPILEDYEIEILVNEAKLADADGVAPSTVGWIPTWNINLAVSIGWELKAGKVAGAYNFSDMGQKFDRKQMYDNCLAMAKRYRGSTFMDVKTSSPITVIDDEDAEYVIVEDEE